jgi:hypothetical protein
MRFRTTVLVAALLALPSGTAIAQTTPGGPIANGNFESHAVPGEASGPLEDTPANECIGIGHQANWGSDTPQGTLVGDDPTAITSDPSNADPDPVRFVERYTGAENGPESKAQQDAEEQSGYGHCEFSDEKGHDAYWINPAQAGGTTDEDAFRWSVGSQATASFRADDEPIDKEIQIDSAPSNGGDHNLWQNMFQPGQQAAYTANFDALELDVENHETTTIPSDAFVQISLGAEPLNVQEPYTVVYIDCADPDCPDDLGDSASERRQTLGRLSIVQVSFWNFNDGNAPVVIDDVGLPGATTHAEEAADGNARVCTDVAGPANDATCGTDVDT